MQSKRVPREWANKLNKACLLFISKNEAPKSPNRKINRVISPLKPRAISSSEEYSKDQLNATPDDKI